MYDDRLEITSSGTLHFGLTPEVLFEPHESRPWNPSSPASSTGAASSRRGDKVRSGWLPGRKKSVYPGP
ncbi:MAG: hypothetical protein Q9Q13_14280 [Acidobacteriota bacterium]|nr:hypothetical protein [Acidobacteriota bacterium]